MPRLALDASRNPVIVVHARVTAALIAENARLARQAADLAASASVETSSVNPLAP